MNNLEKAQQLLKSPITVETLLNLDNLCQQSHGAEADKIGDLWEAAMVQAEQEVIDEYHLQVLKG
ncbi:hypothetical protein [Vibrio furnissii]|uniref:hypothetical protein n=1 Tax=Vibrio furnissii TaxID=29494 RepID=UPI001EEA9589|nr:hypothetical protein [Vibrio furnissii]MCG6233101.1 hypothetical protein [Vibrio furnissii]MCG6258945.1 hypothetical protein [Vibrio furnissii]WJG22155.1 hypothetical protein QSU95_03030 [Vibrio furnissii]